MRLSSSASTMRPRGPIPGLIVRLDLGATHEGRSRLSSYTRVELGLRVLGSTPETRARRLGSPAGITSVGIPSKDAGMTAAGSEPIAGKLLANEYLEDDFSGGLTRALPSTDPDGVHVGQVGERFRGAAGDVE